MNRGFLKLQITIGLKMEKFFLLLALLYFAISAEAISQVKIGVILPLMKNLGEQESSAGRQILNGVEDALREFDSVNSILKIKIVIKDSERNPENVLDILNEFGSDSGCIAVFGPVFSSEIINNAGAAAFHKMPVITPTATQNFLAEKNEYFFQLNPTYDIRGRLIAKFATEKLGFKNFLILSEDSYGKNFSESFADEVSKRSGRITYTKNYSSELLNDNIKNYFSEIKSIIKEKDRFIDFGNLNQEQAEKLRKLNLKFSTADSLINKKLIVSIYKLMGEKAETIFDSEGINYKTLTGETGDFLTGIADAIYIPVSRSEEIPVILTSYSESGINLPVIGTSDWNNSEILIENKTLIKDLFFESDFFIKDKSKEDLINLSDSDFKNYYFGYDGMKLILDKISGGGNTRASLNEALQNVNNFKAEHCSFTIKERTNHQMHIMKFESGEIKLLMDLVY